MARPVVDGIERALADQVAVYRLDVADSAALRLASRYGVRYLPTLVVVDRQGAAVLKQVGRLNKEAVLDAAADVLADTPAEPDSIQPID